LIFFKISGCGKFYPDQARVAPHARRYAGLDTKRECPHGLVQFFCFGSDQMFTLLGGAFLPICLYFWRTPARLLELVFVGSVFAAAAVVVIGSYGVMPGLIPAVLFIGFFLLTRMFGGRYPAEGLVLSVMTPFLLVAFGAIVSSFLMPRLFAGEILVWPQKFSGFLVITPLAPNAGNYTQDMYLLLDTLLALTASLYLTRAGLDLRRLLDAYFVSGLLVVLISLWQFLANTLHIWFPTTFFLSNPGWALLSDESLGAIVRLTGPFSEPSALAGYLCGSTSAAAWVILHGDKSILPRLVFVGALGVTLLSTSTTGYATLTIMAGVFILYAAITRSRALRMRAAVGIAGAVALTTLAVVSLPAVAPGVTQQVATVITDTLHKQDSSSFTDRTSTDRDSVNEMIESYGLGVGWGSNRSSSLGPGLCASIGVWGILGLLWFAAGVVWHVRAAHRAATSQESRLIMRACSAALFGTLTAGFVAGPTISSPDFYVLLSLLIATAGRVRYEARTAQTNAATPRIAAFSPKSPYKPQRLSKGL
jgi:hypothetical protein